jgi:hypothetical protein
VKSLVATFITATLGAACTAGYANTNNLGAEEQNAPLLLIGPVESVSSTHTFAVVLGQKVLIGAFDQVTVGETLAVYGQYLGDGSLNAAKVVSEGAYVPGATPVFVEGTVQKVQPSVGQVTVSGLSVDLTSLMSRGAVSPIVGSKLQITGIQPVNNGLVVASGLSTEGISGGGKAVADGISGGGFAVNGISGGGKAVADGISGGGKAVVANGISGGGLAVNGISGGGKAVADGISGGGKAVVANGISGGGLAVNGISGGGKAVADGISGGGLN